MRLIVMAAICAAQMAGADPLPQGNQILGVWGFEDAPDMTCAVNPVLITHDAAQNRLEFAWGKIVVYADRSRNNYVAFTLLQARKRSLQMRRDGVQAQIKIAPDGESFYFFHDDAPDGGSTFVRCPPVPVS